MYVPRMVETGWGVRYVCAMYGRDGVGSAVSAAPLLGVRGAALWAVPGTGINGINWDRCRSRCSERGAVVVQRSL